MGFNTEHDHLAYEDSSSMNIMQNNVVAQLPSLEFSQMAISDHMYVLFSCKFLHSFTCFLLNYFSLNKVSIRRSISLEMSMYLTIYIIGGRIMSYQICESSPLRVQETSNNRLGKNEIGCPRWCGGMKLVKYIIIITIILFLFTFLCYQALTYSKDLLIF